MAFYSENLNHTLSVINININDYKYNIVDYSPPEETEKFGIYKVANQLFLEEIKKPECSSFYHVTGEMRAYLDALHRRVNYEFWKKNKIPGNLIFYLPQDLLLNAENIIKYNKDNWPQYDCFNIFGMVSLIKNGLVNLYRSLELAKVHYTVFGNKHSVLQQVHDHKIVPKAVWIIESEGLVDTLEEKAKEIIKQSECLSNPTGFYSFINSITNDCARYFLFTLQEQKKLQISFIDTYLREFSEQYNQTIANLKLLEMIIEKDGSIFLSKFGHEYINIIEG